METRQTTVSVYRGPREAERAWQGILSAGFRSQCISVIGSGHHAGEPASGYYTAISGEPQYWGSHRSFWNNLWQELHGAAFLWLPQLGPVIVAGPMARTMVAELHRAGRDPSLSVLGESLVALGVDPEAAGEYENAVMADRLLFVMESDSGEAAGVCPSAGRLPRITPQIRSEEFAVA